MPETPPPPTRPAPKTATLSAEQSDRLYRAWLGRITDQVGDAVALTVGYQEHSEDTVTALTRDLTAIRLIPEAPKPACHPHNSPGWHALTARRHLNEAQVFHATFGPEYALRLLQSAAEHARTALRELGWTPAA